MEYLQHDSPSQFGLKKLSLDSLGEPQQHPIWCKRHENMCCDVGNIMIGPALQHQALALVEGKMSSQKHQTVLQGNEERPGNDPSRSPQLDPAEMLITE